MHNIRIQAVIALIAAIFVTHSAFAADNKNESSELLMGVVPFMSPEALFKRMSPLEEYLSHELNQKVIIELNKSGAQLIKRTDAGRYDMVFTAANLAIRAFDSGLYVPGAIPSSLTTAVFLVHSSSSINSIEQLKGKVVATPQKKGTIAVMAPTFFREHGFSQSDMPKIVNYASQNAAFLAVENGDVDAAFIAEFGFRKMLSKYKPPKSSPVKQIFRTKPFPGISMIISSHLSDDLREKIITSMLNLNKSEKGKIVLKKISFSPFKRSSSEEFDVIRYYFKSRRSSKNGGGNSQN